MAQSVKQLTIRIKGVENTRKVTSAMEMISVARLNKLENVRQAMDAYFLSLQGLMSRLGQEHELTGHPLFDKRLHVNRFGVCVITSDNGLCGVYNTNIIRAAEAFINSKGKENVDLIVVGRRGQKYFNQRGLKPVATFIGLNGRYSDDVADQVMDKMIELFLSGKVDEVYTVSSHSASSATQKPEITKLLNIELQGKTSPIEYIFEPSLKRILDEIVPKYVRMRMRFVLLRSFHAEHSARALAMRMSTNNAKELLEHLILVKNKVRQSNITQEIMEVISSTEALKG